MNATPGSAEGLKAPLSLFETAGTSLSQAGILISIRRYSHPSVENTSQLHPSSNVISGDSTGGR